MSIAVLTAVSDQEWEAAMVAALGAGQHGVHVVRRCTDLADALAAATAGLARAAVVSADFRRLDRDALTRLSVAGVAVIGLVPDGAEDAERRLRQLGVAHVVASSATPEAVAETIRTAVGTAPTPAGFAVADPWSAATGT
ncbi:MAG: chromosome partitioning protein, partial [Frankiales bacterium]|nr:chromosome partitioning protein [Frankiales bacterium]